MQKNAVNNIFAIFDIINILNNIFAIFDKINILNNIFETTIHLCSNNTCQTPLVYLYFLVFI